jgi:hypothetical protein
MTSETELVVGCDGDVRCIYDEALDLRELGKLHITRASHVEPDAEGFWWADMGPVGGPVLGPYANRSEALGAEREWLLRPTIRLQQPRLSQRQAVSTDTSLRPSTHAPRTAKPLAART